MGERVVRLGRSGCTGEVVNVEQSHGSEQRSKSLAKC